MNDQIISWLRTVTPALWGSFVAWLLSLATYPEWMTPLTDILQSEGATVFVLTFVIGAWYAVWRKVEPKIPAWLTRIVLGSNQSPTYLPDGSNQNPTYISE